MSITTAAEIDRKTDELRAATRAANEALADLKRERKALEDDVNQFRRIMQTSIHERIDECVVANLERLQQQVDEQIQRSTKAVIDRFDTLSDILTGQDRDSQRRGLPSIEELAEARDVFDRFERGRRS
jgi:ABC-type transporter MlaC component